MSISWNHSWDKTSRKKTVEGALVRVESMLTKSLLSAKAVKRDSDAKKRYVTAFNDPDLKGLSAVQDILEIMLNRIALINQDLEMINVPDKAAFDALKIGSLPAGMKFENVEAFVIQSSVPPTETLRMFICPAFYTGDVYIPVGPHERSGTGTILHELSHGVAGTADHAYSWEAAFSGLSWLEHCNNADSYRQYCQSFDN